MWVSVSPMAWMLMGLVVVVGGGLGAVVACVPQVQSEYLAFRSVGELGAARHRSLLGMCTKLQWLQLRGISCSGCNLAYLFH
jgi:hypothetical protein